eukprot:1421720-Amphidinium_carterae.1
MQGPSGVGNLFSKKVYRRRHTHTHILHYEEPCMCPESIWISQIGLSISRSNAAQPDGGLHLLPGARPPRPNQCSIAQALGEVTHSPSNQIL